MDERPQVQPDEQGLPFWCYYVSASLTQQPPLFPSYSSAVLKPDATERVKVTTQNRRDLMPKMNKSKPMANLQVLDYDTQIQHGYGKDTPWIGQGQTLHIKSMASDMIQQDTWPILKYPELRTSYVLEIIEAFVDGQTQSVGSPPRSKPMTGVQKT